MCMEDIYQCLWLDMLFYGPMYECMLIHGVDDLCALIRYPFMDGLYSRFLYGLAL